MRCAGTVAYQPGAGSRGSRLAIASLDLRCAAVRSNLVWVCFARPMACVLWIDADDKESPLVAAEAGYPTLDPRMCVKLGNTQCVHCYFAADAGVTGLQRSFCGMASSARCACTLSSPALLSVASPKP